MVTRRDFIKTSTIAGVASLSGINIQAGPIYRDYSKKITIETVNSEFEREPLIRPFGFKGVYQNEFWQIASYMRSESGIEKVGLGTQCVPWSDAAVFSAHSESAGNLLMYALTDFALQRLKGHSFTSPVELLDEILEEVYQYGVRITVNPKLRMTFALNALVGVDNAAWLLYAAENGIRNFDQMVPTKYRPAFSHHNDKVAAIPLMAYAIPIEEIVQAVEEGYFFMKIKIGQPGTQEEMLQKDMERLTAIHKAIGHYKTPYTATGKLPYYFDANGRYETKDTLLRLIEHAKKIGAYDQIAIIEEPFPEEADILVDDIPLRLAADESAHTDEDVRTRIEMGYKAIALKPAAKTLSMTMKMANTAKELNIPCFIADLTVNPILVDWNKNVAARLDPFPGLGTGLQETNGHQNYRNWKVMESYHPFTDASWRKQVKGVFNLNADYYAKSGGILTDSEHYMQIFTGDHS